ncbi:hypothetical protein ACW0TQ_08035 [Oceanobacillus sp. M60]|uniref:Uncharacterized protein n=1 Tax=Oceanobacillus aidingensis TaxID=645964 RepID=A0ABV9JVC3_9BACI
MGVVKFKTNGKHVPMLKQTGNVRIVHEDKEFAFYEDQLDRIANDWNNGMRMEDLAEQEGRLPLEILFALTELAEEDRITRPMGYIY